MKKFFKKPTSLGLPPGTLLPSTKAEQPEVQLTVIVYGQDTPYSEKHPDNVKETIPDKEKNQVTWINVDEILNEFGAQFGIHPLVLEDINTPNQRPKMDENEQLEY